MLVQHLYRLAEELVEGHRLPPRISQFLVFHSNAIQPAAWICLHALLFLWLPRQRNQTRPPIHPTFITRSHHDEVRPL